MSTVPLLVLGLIAALGTFLVVDGMLRFLTDRARAHAAAEAPAGEHAAGDRNIRLAEPAGTRLGRYLQLLLQRADLQLSEAAVAGIVTSACLACLLILHLVVPSWPWWAALVLAVMGGVLVPFAYVRRRGRRRTEQFLELFPDALDLIVRSLRIGHPLSVAIGTVGAEMPDPVGKEFRLAAQQISYGMSPPQAVDALSKRINVKDVRFFAVTVQIQYESGGNLSEILESLSSMIRSRFQLFRRVRALTAEGRFSAWFLSLLPVAMIFIISYLQPDYYSSVSDFEYYTPLVVVTLSMLALNAAVARWITRMRI